MGESYGRFRVGNDNELIRYINSGNLAAGFHGGDPVVIKETVRLAKKHDVGIGAHVSLPDLMGFGRRRMDITPEECRDYSLYQIGGVAAFAKSEKLKLQHVKPHGRLWDMVEENESLAEALVDAMIAFDPELVLVINKESGPHAFDVAKKRGLRIAEEGYPDLNYGPDGVTQIERVKLAWDPDLVAQRAVDIVKHNRVKATDGSYIKVKAETICIHGDAPNSSQIASKVREVLAKEDVEMVRMSELV
jgi:UPF0271 protein